MVTNTIVISDVVPTDDNIVRRQLRHLNHPMSFFGESPKERRERLSKAIAGLSAEEKQELKRLFDINVFQKISDNDETSDYEGPDGLLRARYDIARYSVQQAYSRLIKARNVRDELRKTRHLEESSKTETMKHQDLLGKIRQIEDMGTYIDEEFSDSLKTLTSCNLNPDGNLVATSYQSGRCKLWSIDRSDMMDETTSFTMKPKISYESIERGSRSNFIVFNPKPGGHESKSGVANLASCAMNGSIVLWDSHKEGPVCKLSGSQKWHATRVRYHPCGSYLASACSDQSWRFYDLTCEREILQQEGHADAVFDLAFHPDGSLVASAGKDSYGLIWDLRTGHYIHRLEGHTGALTSIDFSPNGNLIATGGMDNTVKVWDIRKKNLVYTIPAHTNIVTTVIFEKDHGRFLVTSSFDKSVKFWLWSNKTWVNVKTLDVYDDKVTRVDLSNNSDLMISCHSKNLKLWSMRSDG